MSLICTMSDCPTCPIAGTKSYCPEDAGKESEYVKIIRCKDCKNRMDFGEQIFCNVWASYSGFGDNQIKLDDYCSYGERMTE